MHPKRYSESVCRAAVLYWISIIVHHRWVNHSYRTVRVTPLVCSHVSDSVWQGVDGAVYVCVWTCGRACPRAFPAAVLQPEVCLSALLSPLFGEFLCSLPETNMIYCPTQVQTDCKIDHILTESEKKCWKKNLFLLRIQTFHWDVTSYKRYIRLYYRRIMLTISMLNEMKIRYFHTDVSQKKNNKCCLLIYCFIRGAVYCFLFEKYIFSIDQKIEIIVILVKLKVWHFCIFGLSWLRF